MPPLQLSPSTPVSLDLCLGAPLGHGTSGVVSPLLAAVDGGQYVVKEVSVEDGDDERVLQEVMIHRICSAGCQGVVRYAFAAATGGADSRRLLVFMEACAGDLWDALVAPRPAPQVSTSALAAPRPDARCRRSSLHRRPGTRRASRASVSSPNVGALLGSRPLAALPATPEERRTSFVSGGPSEAECRLWTRTLCEAVRHCHSLRILHRDLNPWNALTATEREADGSRAVRLADFGLAVRLRAEDAELEGLEAEGFADLDASALGSLYSAPELGERYSLPADVFSLGMTLLVIWAAADLNSESGDMEGTLAGIAEAAKDAAVAGSPPPMLDSLASLAAHAPLRELLARMLARTPDARPSAADACAVVERCLPPSDRPG